MNKNYFFMACIILCFHVNGQSVKTRPWIDPVGFASESWQMDSIINRLSTSYYTAFYDSLAEIRKVDAEKPVRFVVCPHDDYTYAGYLYKEVFCHFKAKTIIVFGVAHKARKFGIDQKIVFDDFEFWKAPYGDLKISSLREQIISSLSSEDYIIHDSLQSEEHSVEALIPFMQYYNRKVQIIPILIPYMSFSTMQSISRDLANAIAYVMEKNNLQWGNDVALVVSTDAVHYGNEDWGGKDYAPFGCGSAGHQKAVKKEKNIMNECLACIDPLSAEKFFHYTVQDSDWHKYKWTWCGRYSVPFAMLTAYYLQQKTGTSGLIRSFSDYSTSINQAPLKVNDLKMGATAPANPRHWVGYCVSVYY